MSDGLGLIAIGAATATAITAFGLPTAALLGPALVAVWGACKMIAHIRH